MLRTAHLKNCPARYTLLSFTISPKIGDYYVGILVRKGMTIRWTNELLNRATFYDTMSQPLANQISEIFFRK